MPGCILHVYGLNFDPGRVLPALRLQPYQEFAKGDVRLRDSKDKHHYEEGGFKCEVSRSDGLLSQHIAEAISFLKLHEVELRYVRALAEVESMHFDFGYDSRFDGDRCVIQVERLPIELLKLCGSIGIEIMLSTYPPTKSSHQPE